MTSEAPSEAPTTASSELPTANAPPILECERRPSMKKRDIQQMVKNIHALMSCGVSQSTIGMYQK